MSCKRDIGQQKMGDPKVKRNSGEAFGQGRGIKMYDCIGGRRATPLASPTSVAVAEIPLALLLGGGIGGPVESCAVLDTFVLEVALEELQAHQGKDAEAEDGEDGHISQLPHRVDQGPHDDLQPCGDMAVTLARG